jgi:hypothetical protein
MQRKMRKLLILDIVQLLKSAFVNRQKQSPPEAWDRYDR